MKFIEHLLAEARPSRPTTMSHQEKTQLMQLLSKAFVVSQSLEPSEDSSSLLSSNDNFYQMVEKISAVLEQLPEEDDGGGFDEEEEEPLTPGQQADKDDRRAEVKRMHKQIFQQGPNAANPWAEEKRAKPEKRVWAERRKRLK